MSINLNNLRVFYAAAKTCNFTKAAAQLNLTQPAVSTTIQMLEHRLGVKLFERLSKGLRLTAEGERLFDFAQRTVEEANHLVRLISDKTLEPQGELRIVTTPALATTWLAKYLPPFLEQHPKLNVEIIGKSDALELENADVIIRSFIPHQPNLVQRRIASVHNKLWAHPSYLEKFGVPTKPEDLDHHRLLVYGGKLISPYANLNWILEVGARPEAPREPYLKINFLEGLVNFANQGMGIIEMPEEHMRLRDVNLVEVLPALKGPITEIFYIYPKTMKEAKRITALADYLESING